jgi:hypothetical protein
MLVIDLVTPDDAVSEVVVQGEVADVPALGGRQVRGDDGELTQ